MGQVWEEEVGKTMSNITKMLQSNIMVDSMEMALIHIEAKREFSFGIWTSRQHIFLKASAQGCTGWGEEIISLNQPNISLVEWSSKLQELKDMQLGQMFAHMEGWHFRLRELTEMALIDLYGKINGISALELFNLTGRAEVPGLYCILEQDASVLLEKATQAAHLGFQTHLKVKLFGNMDVDIPLVTAAKKAIPGVFLLGDANMGYRPAYRADGDLTDVAEQLKELHSLGLDACEDPAEMDQVQWIRLQQLVQPLKLVPDVPMRPAATAMETIVPEMGDMFNIHPGSMGSLLDAVRLIHKIQSFGGEIMIGDNSLVGPACTAWQQIAIGAGAEFVEALEKDAEYPQFYDLIVQCNTEVSGGKVVLKQQNAGFGLELDTKQLMQYSRIWHVAFYR